LGVRKKHVNSTAVLLLRTLEQHWQSFGKPALWPLASATSNNNNFDE